MILKFKIIMWCRKTFANHQEMLNWLNNKYNILRIQQVQIMRPDNLYEVFYWDSWALKNE